MTRADRCTKSRAMCGSHKGLFIVHAHDLNRDLLWNKDFHRGEELLYTIIRKKERNLEFGERICITIINKNGSMTRCLRLNFTKTNILRRSYTIPHSSICTWSRSSSSPSPRHSSPISSPPETKNISSIIPMTSTEYSSLSSTSPDGIFSF